MNRIQFVIVLFTLTLSSLGQKVTDINVDYQKLIGTLPYLFTLNGDKYVISYDTLKNKERYDSKGYLNPQYKEEVGHRPVYLFRNDGTKWVKATISPIQYDYETLDSIGYSYYNDGSKKIERYFNSKAYHNDYNTGDPSGGRVKILKDGRVALLISYKENKTVSIGQGKDFRPNTMDSKILEMVVLTPFSDKIFTPKVFRATNYLYDKFWKLSSYNESQSLLSQMDTYDANNDSFALNSNGEMLKFQSLNNVDESKLVKDELATSTNDNIVYESEKSDTLKRAIIKEQIKVIKDNTITAHQEN